MKTIAVDRSGTPHEIQDEKESDFPVFARWTGTRYFALASGDGDLFDVLDSCNDLSKKDRERGGMFWRLRTCSKECYDSYTSFLRSKNRTPFILAQRRFRSDF